MEHLNLPIPPDEPGEPTASQPAPASHSSRLHVIPPTEPPKQPTRHSLGTMIWSKPGKAVLCALAIAIVWAAVITWNRRPTGKPEPGRITRSAPSHTRSVKKQPVVSQKVIAKKTGKTSAQAKSAKKKTTVSKTKRKPWLAK